MKLSKYQREHITDIRREIHDAMAGDLRVCDQVSLEIERYLGFKMEAGTCDHDLGLMYHCWNLLPDGSILDATADQFGLDGIIIVEEHHPTYGYYKSSARRETSVRRDYAY